MFRELKCFKTVFVFVLGFLVVFSSVGFTSIENEEELLEDDTIEWFHSASVVAQTIKELSNSASNSSFSCGYRVPKLPENESLKLGIQTKMFILYQRMTLFH